MKFFLIISVSIFNLFSISCSSPEDLQVKQPNSTPVMEMSEEYIGIWSMTGEILDFRLYDNGLVEFDVVDADKKAPRGINSTEDFKTQKQAYISEDEVKAILDLLTSDEFLRLNHTYEPERSCTDNFINNTIRLQYENKDKTVKIIGHCDNLASPNLEHFPDFPPVLMDLYKKISTIKAHSQKN